MRKDRFSEPVVSAPLAMGFPNARYPSNNFLASTYQDRGKQCQERVKELKINSNA